MIIAQETLSIETSVPTLVHGINFALKKTAERFPKVKGSKEGISTVRRNKACHALLNVMGEVSEFVEGIRTLDFDRMSDGREEMRKVTEGLLSDNEFSVVCRELENLVKGHYDFIEA